MPIIVIITTVRHFANTLMYGLLSILNETSLDKIALI